MNKRKIDVPQDAPVPRGAYSMALAAGEFVFVAGQSARDKDLNIVSSDIGGQTRRTIENIEMMLTAARVSWSDVVKATVHLSDLNYFGAYDKIYAEMVPEPRPVRTTVGSTLAPGILIEIDVIAYGGVNEQ
ncbi:RidA family protein [Tardiphaga sp. 172_B4_N1_3]|uniref:RidA family protein n=1 Tax=Tardiphaga sp. 172_B4_N1_3 TaxID=3240787 RepID=UPI003F886466